MNQTFLLSESFPNQRVYFCLLRLKFLNLFLLFLELQSVRLGYCLWVCDLNCTVGLFFKFMWSILSLFFRRIMFEFVSWRSCIFDLCFFTQQVDVLINLNFAGDSGLIVELYFNFTLSIGIHLQTWSRWLYFAWFRNFSLLLQTLLFWVDRWIKVFSRGIDLTIPFLVCSRLSRLWFFGTCPLFPARRHDFSLFHDAWTFDWLLLFGAGWTRPRALFAPVNRYGFRLLWWEDVFWFVDPWWETKLIVGLKLDFFVDMVLQNILVHRLLALVNICWHFRPLSKS